VLRLQEAGLLAERIELLEGELWDMPAEGAHHASLKVWLNEYLVLHKPANVRVACDTTVRLSDRYWPSPDFVLFPATRNIAEVTGPELLLVIEISDSSLRDDLVIKGEAYRRHGVREYWVCDLAARATYVHQLNHGWPNAAPVPFAQPLTPLLAPTLRLRMADAE